MESFCRGRLTRIVFPLAPLALNNSQPVAIRSSTDFPSGFNFRRIGVRLGWLGLPLIAVFVRLKKSLVVQVAKRFDRPQLIGGPATCGRRRNAPAIEIAFQRKDDPTHVCGLTHAGHQAGLAQSRQRVAQLRQPTPQTTARRVTDPHMLDQFQRADSALVQIGNRLAVAV